MSAPKLKRPLYGPDVPLGPSHGRDVKDFVKRTLHRLPGSLPVGENFFPKPAAGFNDIYNAKTVEAVKVFQMYAGVKPHTGQFGQRTLDEMWPYADAYSRWVYRAFVAPKPEPPPPVVCFPFPIGGGGEVCQGPHPTAGLLGNIAIDFCDRPLDPVLCVEAGTIQKLSGHDPADDTWDSQGVFGWSVYVRTEHGYVYYYTHLGRRNSLIVGQRVQTGEILGWVGDQRWRPDHTHIGITSPLGIADATKRILAVSVSPRVAVL